MGRRLASFVHAYDDEGNHGVFGPDDEVPDWAQKVMGDHVWESEDFDPSAHTVAEVQTHLETADESERERVLAAEGAGKARATLLDNS